MKNNLCCDTKLFLIFNNFFQKLLKFNLEMKIKIIYFK